MNLRKHTLFLVAITGLFAAGCSTPEPTGVTPADAGPCDGAGANPLLCARRMNIAHRGGGILAPEETLPAFQNAADLGVDMLELDVHGTADGAIVCMHDNTVDRTTNGTGRIDEMTLAELRELDAGHGFSPDGGATHPYRGKGVVVATLDEVLSAFPGRLFSIELKQASPTIVDPVIAIIEAHDASERVVLASFYDDTLTEIRAARPNVLTSFGLGEMVTFQTLTDENEGDYVPPARVIQAPFDSVTAESLARAERFGLVIEAWTVNDRAEMDRLLALNVHGIMSDDPALLATAIAEHAAAK